jgi:hypothetical protein
MRPPRGYRAFRAGYTWGASRGFVSAVTLWRRFPRLSAEDVDSFLQGCDDGQRRDPFRLEALGLEVRR